MNIKNILVILILILSTGGLWAQGSDYYQDKGMDRSLSHGTYSQRQGKNVSGKGALKTLQQITAGSEKYSISPGMGAFYAIRHHRSADKPYIEIVGSEIALNRAKHQAQEGAYTLDIQGPFAGILEATAFVRSNWDPSYGKPRRKAYVVMTPLAEKAEGE